MSNVDRITVSGVPISLPGGLRTTADIVIDTEVGYMSSVEIKIDNMEYADYVKDQILNQQLLELNLSHMLRPALPNLGEG